MPRESGKPSVCAKAAQLCSIMLLTQGESIGRPKIASSHDMGNIVASEKSMPALCRISDTASAVLLISA